MKKGEGERGGGSSHLSFLFFLMIFFLFPRGGEVGTHDHDGEPQGNPDFFILARSLGWAVHRILYIFF